MNARNKLIAFAAGLGWAMLNVAAVADDTELFVGNAATGSQAKPNILFIIDDSLSMEAVDVLTQNNYNPATDYPGNCGGIRERIYWTQSGTLPSCDGSNNNWFNWHWNSGSGSTTSGLHCKRAWDALNAPLGGVYAAGRIAQFNTSNNRWEAISAAQKDRRVECEIDRPATGWTGHGRNGSPTPNVYARDTSSNGGWSTSGEIAWASKSPGQPYTLYSGNYLDWAYQAGNLQERMTVMKEVASNVVQAMDGVNIGLMHFNNFDQGAVVIHAMQDVSSTRPALLGAIDNLEAENATPLQESLYEAYLYMTGKPVNYGTGGAAGTYVAGSTPLRYESPMDLECQKNHIVLLTDGAPVNDDGMTASITSAVDSAGRNFTYHTGSGTCDTETYPAGTNPLGPMGHCLDDFAEFLYEGDHSPLNGQQNIVTHTVGFLANFQVLQQAAQRGGGQYYTASNTVQLTDALLSIITSVLDTQTTFIAPTVSVNSFNQTRNMDDLYFSVFRPTGTAHWPGNLKKYRLQGATGTIVDALGNNAINPTTGFFSATSRSIWTDPGVTDGEEVHLGGAANLIPATRTVYTYLGSGDQPLSANPVTTGNTSITEMMLNVSSATQRTQVIEFINGLDRGDHDRDGVTDERRYQMGDPLHAQPVTVVYGPTNTDARIYFATNDGFLHSIHANTGVEQWAFVPEEFLDNQLAFMNDDQLGTGSKIYGVDGNLRVQLVNANSDGVIDDDEKVFLFVSMRRGGDVFYALDITDPDAPTVMWRKDSSPTSLPGMGDGFSSAMPTRMLVGTGAAQNADRTVVVIGGGYSTAQDGYVATTDTPVGNSIYIVDSENGTLLWHGSGNTGATKVFTNGTAWAMNYSIPGDIRVLDLNGDRLADRMYAADMGGQVWRFDVRNGNDAASLIDGGVIAQLGAAGITAPTLADTRRFYYAPDVALASNNQYSYLHIGVGSGYREHPQEMDNHNAFYALRDYKTFGSMDQLQYDGVTPIVPGDLVDVTANATASVPQGSPGWKLDLVAGGGWNGEKVLAETRTFNNRVFVTTFRPGTAGVNCHPALGTNRQYVMSLFTGAPINNRDGSTGTGPLTESDRYTEWEGAPPPETIFIFTDQGINSCVGTECGLEDFPQFPIRTFWTQESIEGNP